MAVSPLNTANPIHDAYSRVVVTKSTQRLLSTHKQKIQYKLQKMSERSIIYADTLKSIEAVCSQHMRVDSTQITTSFRFRCTAGAASVRDHMREIVEIRVTRRGGLQETRRPRVCRSEGMHVVYDDISTKKQESKAITDPIGDNRTGSG